MRWLISVFCFWFILECKILSVCLVLVVIPMQNKKPIQNYFDNHLVTKEKMGENVISCICGNLDPNCVSQNISQKNDGESGRFCNTDAICVLCKTLQLPGEYVPWQLQCVMPSPWGNECRTQKQERLQEHGQLWQDPHPNGKYAVTLSDHCGYLTFI